MSQPSRHASLRLVWLTMLVFVEVAGICGGVACLARAADEARAGRPARPLLDKTSNWTVEGSVQLDHVQKLGRFVIRAEGSDVILRPAVEGE